MISPKNDVISFKRKKENVQRTKCLSAIFYLHFIFKMAEIWLFKVSSQFNDYHL